MIHLYVEDYCQDCPEFEPEKSMVRGYDLEFDGYINTIVHCEHQERCEKFMRYLKGKLKESDKN